MLAVVTFTARRERYREQRENTRRQILAAADTCLRERPYRELSVEVVMAGTGLTRTAFYRHFDDISDLVLQLIEEFLRDLYAVAERWSAEAGEAYPIPAQIGLHATVNFFAAQGPLVRAITEAAVADERIEHGHRRLRAPFIELTARTLDRLTEEGRLDVPDTRSMAEALNLMTEAYLLEQFGREPIGSPEEALATLETIWLRALAPPPSSHR